MSGSSTAADRPRRAARLAAWLSHHERRVVLVAFALFAAEWVLTLLLVPQAVSVTSQSLGVVVAILPLGVSGLLLTVLLVFLVPGHHASLCETCVALFPLDGPQQAERHGRLLRLWHWERTGPGLLTDLGFFVSYAMVVNFLRPSPLVGGTIWFVYVSVFLTGTAWLRVTHRRLEVWCPQCRNGGRGPREHVPPPVPVIAPDLSPDLSPVKS